MGVSGRPGMCLEFFLKAYKHYRWNLETMQKSVFEKKNALNSVPASLRRKPRSERTQLGRSSVLQLCSF